MQQVPVVSYEEARSLIKSGDLLSFRTGSRDAKPMHWLTEMVTRSPYYHTGIAVWLSSEGGESRLFICEAQPSGRRLVPLSMFANLHFDVTESPVAFELIEKMMLERVGAVPYGFLDYIGVGVRMLFGIAAKDDNGAEICSEMAQDLFRKAGLVIPEHPLAPNELKEFINDLGFKDRILVR